jgi:hypothetical protein
MPASPFLNQRGRKRLHLHEQVYISESTRKPGCREARLQRHFDEIRRDSTPYGVLIRFVEEETISSVDSRDKKHVRRTFFHHIPFTWISNFVTKSDPSESKARDSPLEDATRPGRKIEETTDQ